MCGVEMRIIAFITDSVDVRAILEHIGEPAIPPRIARARSPPEWDEDSGDALRGDPPVPPEPEYDYDQTVTW